MKFSVGGLFSGVGGIELGFKQAGFDTVWANEFDKYSSKTYRLNHGDHLIEDDVHLLQGKDLQPVDVLTGGFPCQAFSVAGYRKGFRDPRGNLFFEIARLIEELDTPPKAIMLENVKGLSSHDKGKTAEVIKDTLRVLGYSVFWNILNTSELTNVPQNRERTIIVGFRDEVGWEDSKDMEFPLASTNFDAIYPPKSKKRNISRYPNMGCSIDCASSIAVPIDNEATGTCVKDANGAPVSYRFTCELPSPPASPSPWRVSGRPFRKCCSRARRYIALVDAYLLPDSGPGKF